MFFSKQTQKLNFLVKYVNQARKKLMIEEN